MRSSHSLDRLDTTFDDDHLVAAAGLLLPATLAQYQRGFTRYSGGSPRPSLSGRAERPILLARARGLAPNPGGVVAPSVAGTL
jgi:hypothetical protein